MLKPAKFVGRPVGRMAAIALKGMGLKIRASRLFQNDYEFKNSYRFVFYDKHVEIVDNFVLIGKRRLPIFIRYLIKSGYKYPFTVYENKIGF